VSVLVRRTDSDDPVGQERAALAEQRAALEDLKHQLAARVAAVKEREAELRAALNRVQNGGSPGIALPPVASPDSERLAMRAANLAERERALAAREAALGADRVAPNGDPALAAELERQGRELEERRAALDAREATRSMRVSA
jgi:hypothetical protein